MRLCISPRSRGVRCSIPPGAARARRRRRRAARRARRAAARDRPEGPHRRSRAVRAGRPHRAPGRGGRATSTTKLNLAQFERRPGEVLLRADVLGHSLINVDTARLVMAREVELACERRRLARRRHRPEPRRAAAAPAPAPLPRPPGRASRTSSRGPSSSRSSATSRRSRLRLAHRRLAQLHPAQIADLVEAASHEEGEEILEAVGQDKELEADVFEELDDEHQLEFLASAPTSRSPPCSRGWRATTPPTCCSRSSRTAACRCSNCCRRPSSARSAGCSATTRRPPAAS